MILPNITYLYEPEKIYKVKLKEKISRDSKIYGYDDDGIHELIRCNQVDLIFGPPTRFYPYETKEYDFDVSDVVTVKVIKNIENNTDRWLIYTVSGVYDNGTYHQLIASGVQNYETTGYDEHLTLNVFPVIPELLSNAKSYPILPAFAKLENKNIETIKIIDILNTWENGEGITVASGEYDVIDNWVIFKPFLNGRPSFDPNFNSSSYNDKQPDPGWNSRYIAEYTYIPDEKVAYVLSAYDKNLNPIIETFKLYKVTEEIKYMPVKVDLKTKNETNILDTDYIIFFDDSQIRPFVQSKAHDFLKKVKIKVFYDKTFDANISGQHIIITLPNSPAKSDYFDSSIFEYVQLPSGYKFNSIDVTNENGVVEYEDLQINEDLGASYIKLPSTGNYTLHIHYTTYDEFEVIPSGISGYVVYGFNFPETIEYVEAEILYEPLVYYEPLADTVYVLQNNIAYSSASVNGKMDVIRFNVTTSGQYISMEADVTYDFKILDVLRVYDLFVYVGIIYDDVTYIAFGYLHESELFQNTNSPRDVTLKFAHAFPTEMTSYAKLFTYEKDGALYIGILYDHSGKTYVKLFKAAYDRVFVDENENAIYFREKFNKVEVT